jgi:hypothetical protein
MSDWIDDLAEGSEFIEIDGHRGVGYVYFVRAGEHFKIGWSQRPEGRVAALQTGNPLPLSLLGSMRGSEDDERALHGAFAHWRAKGEWFRAEPAAMQLVEWILARDSKQRAYMRAHRKLFEACQDAFKAIRGVMWFAPHSPEPKTSEEATKAVQTVIGFNRICGCCGRRTPCHDCDGHEHHQCGCTTCSVCTNHLDRIRPHGRGAPPDPWSA